MKIDRRLLAVSATVAALAGGGAGIAYAVSGESDDGATGGDAEEQVTGPDAQQAKQAALEAVGGGTITSVEREDEGGAALYEVEVERDDGSQVEVAVGDQSRVLGTEADDDTGSGSDDEEEDDAGEDD